mmetsp:Transcript_9429/g.28472  ORF Transcript_9429/g.28472 Transcript_9429/m.28472 type:complete len:290 (-) Transcript_9429:624-1493(-)
MSSHRAEIDLRRRQESSVFKPTVPCVRSSTRLGGARRTTGGPNTTSFTQVTGCSSERVCPRLWPCRPSCAQRKGDKVPSVAFAGSASKCRSYGDMGRRRPRRICEGGLLLALATEQGSQFSELRWALLRRKRTESATATAFSLLLCTTSSYYSSPPSLRCTLGRRHLAHCVPRLSKAGLHGAKRPAESPHWTISALGCIGPIALVHVTAPVVLVDHGKAALALEHERSLQANDRVDVGCHAQRPPRWSLGWLSQVVYQVCLLHQFIHRSKGFSPLPAVAPDTRGYCLPR